MTETAHNASDDHSGGGHAKARYDDIPVGAVLYFGAITVICTLLSILFVKGLLNAFRSNFRAQRAAEVMATESATQIDDQKKLLEGGSGALSIEEAAKKVVEKYGSQH